MFPRGRAGGFPRLPGLHRLSQKQADQGTNFPHPSLVSVLHPTARADETPLPPGGQVRNPEQDARDKTDPDPAGGVVQTGREGGEIQTLGQFCFKPKC